MSSSGVFLRATCRHLICRRIDNLPTIICHVFGIVVILKSNFDICVPFGLHAASFPYNACATCFALGLLTCSCKGLTRGLGVCLMSHVGII